MHEVMKSKLQCWQRFRAKYKKQNKTKRKPISDTVKENILAKAHRAEKKKLNSSSNEWM